MHSQFSKSYSLERRSRVDPAGRYFCVRRTLAGSVKIYFNQDSKTTAALRTSCIFNITRP